MHQNILKTFLFALLTISLSSFAQNNTSSSQNTPLDPSFYEGLEWRNIGPNRGGRSLGSARSHGRPNEYYYGANRGGLWKSTDGGNEWKAVTDGQVTSSSVGAVAIAETNPDVVYIGMGEVQLRGSITQGDGVYKTVDGGKTWKEIGQSPNTGWYEWDSLPHISSNECLIRISDSNDKLITDTSDNVFSISKCRSKLKADLNGDCNVDILDFAILADYWLK